MFPLLLSREALAGPLCYLTISEGAALINYFALRRYGLKLPRYQQILNTLTWMSHTQNLKRVSREHVIDLYLQPPVGKFRLMDFHLMERLVRDANRCTCLPSLGLPGVTHYLWLDRCLEVACPESRQKSSARSTFVWSVSFALEVDVMEGVVFERQAETEIIPSASNSNQDKATLRHLPLHSALSQGSKKSAMLPGLDAQPNPADHFSLWHVPGTPLGRSRSGSAGRASRNRA